MSMEMLEGILKKNPKLTPMMEQYVAIKKNFPDTLVFFRMGDFYELFFDDAIQASKLLNITQTHRGKLGEDPIPMAGIPFHAAANYIDRLTGQGLKVAICEQVEDPKKTKKIVKRAVTQIASPGLPFDLDKAESSEHRYIASAHQQKGKFYFVCLDFGTGKFFGEVLKTEEELAKKIEIYAPKEFITYMGQWVEFPLVQKYLDSELSLISSLDQETFQPKNSAQYIGRLIPGYKQDKTLNGEKGLLKPIAALSFYVCSTQDLEDLMHIQPFALKGEEGKMKFTMHTLQGLEIFPRYGQGYDKSLLGYMDKTVSILGKRKLKDIFLTPLDNKSKLEERFLFLEEVLKADTLNELRTSLEDVRDLEKILAKISTGKATASDLLNLAQSLNSYEELSEIVQKKKLKLTTPLGEAERESLFALYEIIKKTLNDEIGASLEKGNLINPGVHKRRDQLAKLSQNSQQAFVDLEEKYRNKTGIGNLKIKYNNISGYFIEISKSHLSKVPKTFERRQTLVNSERYSSKELETMESEVLSAKFKLEKLERKIFQDLVEQVKESSSWIIKIADDLGTLDVFCAFAHVSKQENFSKPTLSTEVSKFSVKGAWHPLIKSGMNDPFVCQSLSLHQEKFFALITGPNMAGKTTAMREVAIIQFLSQIGCYVPAESVELGLCDFLFSRLGASDDILKGQSTFMVEMSETAEILRHASQRSLIILDEVGRGTSTFDGLSIAWSLVEYICQKIKCLTLFATHYHELIEVVEALPGAQNFTVQTENSEGKVRFLYNLIEEGASESFGIYVAECAGLPEIVLKRSRELLAKLESAEGQSSSSSECSDEILNRKGVQLTFFPQAEGTQKKQAKTPEKESQVVKSLKELDLFNMTPLQAMQKLHELKENVVLH